MHLHAALGRRRRQHGIAPIVRAHRPLPLRLEAAQVFEARRMAAGVEGRDERLGRRSFVEPLATVGGHPPQRRREHGVAQHLAGLERFAVREHQRVGVGEGLHSRLGAGDEAGEDLSHREALVRKLDRGCHHRRQGERPVLLMQGEQTGHFARNGHARQVARLPWLGFSRFRTGHASCWRANRRGSDVPPPRINGLRRVEIEKTDLLLALKPDRRDPAAAEPGHLRLDDADGERRGHCGIDGIASGAQDGDARLAGERVGGGHDTVLRLDAVLPIGGRGTERGRLCGGTLSAEGHDGCRTDRGESCCPEHRPTSTRLSHIPPLR